MFQETLGNKKDNFSTVEWSGRVSVGGRWFKRFYRRFDQELTRYQLRLGNRCTYKIVTELKVLKRGSDLPGSHINDLQESTGEWEIRSFFCTANQFL